jgi:hypothetical protein
MTEGRAAVVGFLVASVIPPAVMSLLWPLSGELTLSDFAASFVLAYPFSALFIAVLGLPAFLVLRRFGPGRWWSVAIAGCLLGAGVAVMLKGQLVPYDLLMACPLATVSVMVFWLIWKQGYRSNVEK